MYTKNDHFLMFFIKINVSLEPVRFASLQNTNLTKIEANFLLWVDSRFVNIKQIMEKFRYKIYAKNH